MSYRSDDEKIMEGLLSGLLSWETVKSAVGADTPNNRAASAVADFIAGRGGGISQLAAKPLSLFGTTHKRWQNKADEMDTANYLYDKMLPVLQQHGDKITVQQVKDVLTRTPLTDGGDNIKVDKLNIFKAGYNDPEMVLDIKQLHELLRIVSGELQEIVAAGSSEYKVDWSKHIMSLTAEQEAELLLYLLDNGYPIPPVA